MKHTLVYQHLRNTISIYLRSNRQWLSFLKRSDGSEIAIKSAEDVIATLMFIAQELRWTEKTIG